MPSFGTASKAQLNTCDNRLITLFDNVVLTYDCTIIEGHRNMVRQNKFYADGRSKVSWPNGKHNKSPSQAVDAAPYMTGRGIPWPVTPTDWNNKEQRDKYIKDLAQFYAFANYVLGMADILDIPIRYGGDWDRDHDLHDNKFDDLVHFELMV